MAISEIYVDPSLAADSGTGTVGDPFGDLEYAIEQTTFDTTNGTRVNIKAGTDEILAADLNGALTNTVTTAAWVPSATAPLIFQGYTSAAGDGGIGGISGGGSVKLYGGAQNFISWVDLHIHNSGANNIIQGTGTYHKFVNCEFDNSSSNGVLAGVRSVVVGCYFHNIAAIGYFGSSGIIRNCVFENGASDFTYAIRQSAAGTLVVDSNIIDIDGTTVGISLHAGGAAINNSVYGDGGTGIGIEAQANTYPGLVINNVVEGFSGTGGNGFDFGTNANVVIGVYGGNSAYNNATEYTAPKATTYALGGASSNETLSASPFSSPTTNDFSPVDTGSVKEGSLPAAFPSF